MIDVISAALLLLVMLLLVFSYFYTKIFNPAYAFSYFCCQASSQLKLVKIIPEFKVILFYGQIFDKNMVRFLEWKTDRLGFFFKLERKFSNGWIQISFGETVSHVLLERIEFILIHLLSL